MQLVDRSVKYPTGVLENVLIKVNNFIIPITFVVLDIEKDVNMLIVLGGPILTIVDAVIDVKKGKLKF